MAKEMINTALGSRIFAGVLRVEQMFNQSIFQSAKDSLNIGLQQILKKLTLISMHMLMSYVNH